MPSINSGVAYDTLRTLKKAFKRTPVCTSQNFNVMPRNVSANKLLRYDSTELIAQVSADAGSMLIAREQANGVTTPLRFLPWGQNCCTGFELDAGAKVVFSGPFSGCCFFIARDVHSRKPVFLHSNDNTNQGAMNRANTLATQRANAQQYMAIYHNGAPLLFHTGYEQMGMVPSFIAAVDTRGSGLQWDIYCINLVSGAGDAVRHLGACLLV
jgi:hypothetical protein